MKQYYYSDGESKFGPLSLDELKKQPLSKNTLIWYKGLEKWRYAKNIPEVLSIIEQKDQEKLLSIKSKDLKKRRENIKKYPIHWKILGVIFLLIIFVFLFKLIGVDFSLPGKNYANENNSNDSFYKQKITSFIKAEDSRDFKKVYSYFAQPVQQYWDSYYPDSLELKNKYDYAWRNSSLSRNDLEAIVKITDQTYDLFTKFTFYHKKQRSFVTRNSRIRFIFNKEGKIKKTYNINISDYDYNRYVNRANK